MGDRRSEATLSDACNLLVASLDQRLGFDFFGAVVDDLRAAVSGKTLYLTGDVARFRGRLGGAARVFAVEELACNYDSLERVSLGRVPVRVGRVGAYYRRFFDDSDFFRRISIRPRIWPTDRGSQSTRAIALLSGRRVGCSCSPRNLAPVSRFRWITAASSCSRSTATGGSRTRSVCGRRRPTTSGSESPFERRRPFCASSTDIQRFRAARA